MADDKGKGKCDTLSGSSAAVPAPSDPDEADYIMEIDHNEIFNSPPREAAAQKTPPATVRRPKKPGRSPSHTRSSSSGRRHRKRSPSSSSSSSSEASDTEDDQKLLDDLRVAIERAKAKRLKLEKSSGSGGTNTPEGAKYDVLNSRLRKVNSRHSPAVAGSTTSTSDNGLKSLMANLLCMDEVHFLDELESMDGAQLIKIYANPKAAILALKSSYGFDGGLDHRSRTQKAVDCATAVRADAMRLLCLASNYLPAEAMMKWHPTLMKVYGKYSMDSLLLRRAAPEGSSALVGEALAAAARGANRYATFLDSINQRMMTEATFAKGLTEASGTLQQEGSGTASAVGLLMGFLGKEDRLDVGDLTWVKNYWLAVALDPQILARTREDLYESVPPAGNAVASMSADEHAAMLRSLGPLKWPAPTEGGAATEITCPNLKADLDEAQPSQPCPSRACSYRRWDWTDSDKITRGSPENCFKYYEAGVVREHAKMREGPYDNRLSGGFRDVVAFNSDTDWLETREQLLELGFFKSLEHARACSLAPINWSTQSLKEMDLLTEDNEQPKGSLAGFVVGAANGVALVVQCLYAGFYGFQGARPPAEIVRILQDATYFKVGFGLHEESRFARLGINLKGVVDATLLALTQFPQPDLKAQNELKRIQSGLPYVAARLGSPSVPVFKYADGREKNVKGATGQLFCVDVAKDHFAKPFGEWSWQMVMSVFSTVSVTWSLMWTAAVRAMELQKVSPRADALRYLRLLLSRLSGMPGVNKIARTNLQMRPWNQTEFHLSAAHTDGTPIKALWATMHHTGSTSVLNPLAAKEVFKAGPAYLIDLYNVDKDLRVFVLETAQEDVSTLTWGTVVDKLLEVGPQSPHFCLKCGSVDHLEPDCQVQSLLCLNPRCRSTRHVLKVCPYMLDRCDLCQLLGHLAKHHSDVDFVRLLEDFALASMFNIWTVLLQEQITLEVAMTPSGLLIRPTGGEQFRESPVLFTRHQ